jgi:hypothetical protein
MIKVIAAVVLAATFYAAQIELFKQTDETLNSVQSQQATALAQIERVRSGSAPIPKAN